MDYDRKELHTWLKILGVVRVFYKISTIISILLLIAAIVLIYVLPSNITLYVILLLLALLFMITSFVLFHEFEKCKNKVCRFKEEIYYKNK